MIRISITAAAFDAIAATLPFGSVAYEPKVNDQGEREIWLEPHILNKLRTMRGPGESYSDVILRLADQSGRAKPKRSPLAAFRPRPHGGNRCGRVGRTASARRAGRQSATVLA